MKEALEVLGCVDKQLCKIAEFWEDIVVVISYIKNKTKAGEVFVKKIEKRRVAERFLERVRAAEKVNVYFKIEMRQILYSFFFISN